MKKKKRKKEIKKAKKKLKKLKGKKKKKSKTLYFTATPSGGKPFDYQRDIMGG